MEPFTTLEPWNKAAMKCFSKVCDAFLENPLQYSHHRRFLWHRDTKLRLRDLIERGSSARDSPALASVLSFSSEGTEPDEENDLLSEFVWSGHYSFSLATPPELTQVGWRVGYGRKWVEDPCGRVDILLAVYGDAKPHRLHGNHAIFNFIQQSGAFAMRCIHDDGAAIGTHHFGPNDKYQVLQRSEQLITLGDLQYKLSFVTARQNEDAFQIAKRYYLVNKLEWEDPIVHVSATPTDQNVHIGEWTLMKSAGAGAQAIVNAAIATDGKMAAVRVVKRLRKDDDAHNTIDLLERIERKLARSNNNRYTLRLHGVLRTNVQPPSEDFLLFTPLARLTFVVLLKQDSDVSREVRLKLFAQVAKGLQALHDARICHRDIKPANLGIVSLQSPHAIVFDYGAAHEVDDASPYALKARPGDGGTVGYLAPEKEAAQGRYGLPADVWSLGCVGYQIFHRLRLPWGHKFNPWRDPSTLEEDQRALVAGLKAEYKGLVSRLQNNLDGLDSLLAEMLEEDPSSRSTMKAMLGHDALREVDLP